MATVQADTLVNSAGSGAPNATYGLKLSGGTYALDAYSMAAEQALPSVTWGAGAAPSGTISAVYKWIQVGKLVTLFWRYNASVNGTTIINAHFQLPSDCPVPAPWTGGGGNYSYSYTGISILCVLGSGAGNASNTNLIYNDTIASQWAVAMQSTSSTASNWEGQIQYVTT